MQCLGSDRLCETDGDHIAAYDSEALEKFGASISVNNIPPSKAWHRQLS